MKRYKKLPWKKNFLKIPENIELKVMSIKEDNLRVTSILSINKKVIKSGIFSHLNIWINNNEINFPKVISPDYNIGRYSSYNIFGREIVRRDLPQYYKTWYVETPNFGDWSKGSHEVEFGKWVYQRDFFPPRFIDIEIELINDFDCDDNVTLKFQLSEILNKNDSSFIDDLLFNLNLLQENTGASDLYSSNATREEFLKTIFINWEILPPGEREENLEKIFSGTNLSSIERKTAEGRYDFLQKFKPINYIKGTSGFQRYFGAKFSENLVVFENLKYGNAIYIMHDNWRDLSKKTRLELLNSNIFSFDRIIHSKNWKMNLYKKLIPLIGNQRNFQKEDFY